MPRSDNNAAYIASLTRDQRRELTAEARKAYREKLEREINPDGTLTPAEVRTELRIRRRAIMAEISRRGDEARRQKAAERERESAKEHLDEMAIIAAALDLIAS